MTDQILPLAADFPAADEAAWLALVDKALKGAPFERLISKTYDGIAIQPLYKEALHPTAKDPAGAPGFFPFTRGALPVRDINLPWDIRQAVRHPDPAEANKQILEDLGGGVSSILLKLDPSGKAGVLVRSKEDLKTILAGVDTLVAPVALEAGANGLEAAKALLEVEASLSAEELRTAYGLDPIGAAFTLGALPYSLAETATFAASLKRPKATAITASARAVHDAGGSEAQELGALAAMGVAYVEALTEASLSAAAANATMSFQISVSAEYGLEVAKLRAARRIWSRIMQAWDAKPADSAMRLHVFTGGRMLSQRDPWVNLLRNTAACFAAGVAGADVVTVLPFTEALGHPNTLARRLARNTQIILQEESHIGRVVDPAGGAWSVEAQTEDLAKAGWAFFQQIESRGGIVSTLESGWLQDEIAKVRKARASAIAKRKDGLIGVNEFPQLQEIEPAVEMPDIAMVANKATGSDIAIKSVAQKFKPLPVWRNSDDFEKLRDAADASVKDEIYPSVFIATLGPLADHNARVGFAQNLLAAGGVGCVEAAIGSDPAAAFKASGLATVCICGADKAYAEQATDTAKALKAAGASWVLLAGKPGDNEEAWRAAGVDQFIFAGQDVISALQSVHAALGLGAKS